MSSSPELRVPSFFPRAPKNCRYEADAFFSCLSSKSQFDDSKDPGVGRTALTECARLMAPYEQCVASHLTDRQKELVRAPQLYLAQAAAGAPAAPAPK